MRKPLRRNESVGARVVKVKELKKVEEKQERRENLELLEVLDITEEEEGDGSTVGPAEVQRSEQRHGRPERVPV